MKKNVYIKIAGELGTGKTAMACYIEDHFKSLGFIVKRHPDLDTEPINSNHKDIKRNLIDLIKTSKLHKNKIEIHIETEQLKFGS